MDAASLPGEETGPQQWAPLIDVSNLPIADLLAADRDSALARSVRRLVDSLDDPNGVISAFSSYVQ